MFLSGLHCCAYHVDKAAGKSNLSSLTLSIVCGLIGVYHIIALIGAASQC